MAHPSTRELLVSSLWIIAPVAAPITTPPDGPAAFDHCAAQIDATCLTPGDDPPVGAPHWPAAQCFAGDEAR
jgi:hypothetical protein